jgi:hypothetical protein
MDLLHHPPSRLRGLKRGLNVLLRMPTARGHPIRLRAKHGAYRQISAPMRETAASRLPPRRTGRARPGPCRCGFRGRCGGSPGQSCLFRTVTRTRRGRSGASRPEAAEDALTEAEASLKQAETEFEAANDRLAEAERMLDEARIDRDSARRERYAARRAHERASVAVERLGRRVSELAERLGRMPLPRGPWPAAPWPQRILVRDHWPWRAPRVRRIVGKKCPVGRSLGGRRADP